MLKYISFIFLGLSLFWGLPAHALPEVCSTQYDQDRSQEEDLSCIKAYRAMVQNAVNRFGPEAVMGQPVNPNRQQRIGALGQETGHKETPEINVTDPAWGQPVSPNKTFRTWYILNPMGGQPVSPNIEEATAIE